MLRRLFEKDPLSFIFGLILIAVVIGGVWLYRKHTRKDNSPDLLDYDGYHKIALTPTGYAITDQGNFFRTLGTFYYLRKDPFSIEVCVEDIQADNGRKYHARAVVTTVLPENRVDYVCRRYLNGNSNGSYDAGVMTAIMSRSNSTASVADIMAGQTQNKKPGSDEMLQQILSGKTHTADNSVRSQKKTTCDAEINMELIVSYSAALKKLITEQGGILSDEEIRKKFLGQAMICAMAAGHAATGITDFSITEIAD